MLITNNQNLPTPMYEFCKSTYEYKDGRYSVTALLKGVREVILERRHANEITQDASEMIWLLFGTAVHSIIENAQESDHELKENSVEYKVDGKYTLSGRFDLYNAKTKTVTDYKTCSVWKVLFGDYEDWRKQLLMYGYMLRQYGFAVERGEITAIMKDHKKSDAKYKPDYPNYPVKVIAFNFTEKDFDDIEQFIYTRFEEIAKAEKLPDNDLPLCTTEERYNDGDKFAVMKKSAKRALRVLDNETEAEEWKNANGGDYIEVRKGTDKKCLEYCSACEFCSHYKEMKEESSNE